MSIPHVVSGEVVNLQTLKADMPTGSTVALVTTSDMEVIRMMLPQGKKIPEHSVPGQISVQCIAGHTVFGVGSETRELKEGDWLYLDGGQPHSLEAVDNSVLLVTILLKPKDQRLERTPLRQK